MQQPLSNVSPPPARGGALGPQTVQTLLVLAIYHARAPGGQAAYEKR